MDAGKLDYAVEVKVPRDRITKISGTKRNIYLHEGPLDVTKYGQGTVKLQE